jgi:hypothetical protein
VPIVAQTLHGSRIFQDLCDLRARRNYLGSMGARGCLVAVSARAWRPDRTPGATRSGQMRLLRQVIPVARTRLSQLAAEWSRRPGRRWPLMRMRRGGDGGGGRCRSGVARRRRRAARLGRGVARRRRRVARLRHRVARLGRWVARRGSPTRPRRADRLTADRLTADRPTADWLTADRLTADRPTADRLTRDRLTADRLPGLVPARLRRGGYGRRPWPGWPGYRHGNHCRRCPHRRGCARGGRRGHRSRARR